MTPRNPLITIPTIEDLTRRQFISGALASALLIACGDDDEQESSGPQTRTINDYFGSVTIPARPERVVCADPTSLQIMVSLGVKPIASYFNPLVNWPHLRNELAGIEDITKDGIDLERALALKADLIITTVGNEGRANNQESYERLMAAIPTFGYMRDRRTYDSVKGSIQTIAMLLNVEDRAKELIDKLDARVASMKQRFERAGISGLPISNIRVQPDSFELQTGDASESVLRELGLTWAVDGDTEISLEQIRLLNGAHTIFVLMDRDSQATLQTIRDNPLWQTLPAVQNNRAHVVEAGTWMGPDTIALNLILDDIEKLILVPTERR